MTTSGGVDFPVRAYHAQHAAFPYAAADFRRADAAADTDFYAVPRFVTHIDDAAIEGLKAYYGSVLPPTGRILDLCSSWISHFPAALAARATATAAASPPSSDQLEVVGVGLNAAELDRNPILSQRVVRDLNSDPDLNADIGTLDAVTCVVSIDYLTQPLAVLAGVKRQMRRDATIHLIVSNRCFPTKAIARWLRMSEADRLRMVGDYLHFTNFTDIETVTVRDGRASDPLWVVRGVNRD